MSVFTIFDVAGSGMSAQMLRLNTIASNMANADTMASKPEDVYKARHPIFESVMNQFNTDGSGVQVRVKGIQEDQSAAIAQYMPGNPLADEKGYVYRPAVNGVAEMADMISASRSYQNNIEALSTAKDMLIRTLSLGRQ